MQVLLPALAIVAAAAAALSGAPPRVDQFKLDNTRLFVTKFDETYAFYKDVLGLTPAWGTPGGNYASFVFANGGQIALFRKALILDVVGTAGRPSTRTEQDTIGLVLEVENVDAACGALRAKGVTFVGEPKNQDAWGIRAAQFRDPDGNLIEVFSPLKK
jgi:catechol 2,3-dioxygenase-like lactoylglutathione lyase family enzyme